MVYLCSLKWIEIISFWFNTNHSFLSVCDANMEDYIPFKNLTLNKNNLFNWRLPCAYGNSYINSEIIFIYKSLIKDLFSQSDM